VSGGVGASSFAAALALAAAPSLLVDADPLGGGLDVLLGLEAEPGPRWSALAATRGRVSADALRDALPGFDGVAVLAHDGPPVPPAALAAVVAAGVGDGGAVVLDLPRTAGPWLVEAGLRLDELVLLVADDVTGVVGATRVAAELRPRATRMRLAVLRSARTLAVSAVGRALDADVVARLSIEPRPAAGSARPSRAWVRAAAEVLA
jgi:MinD-like ATPase involved in chromosome partitioning or flagellar assembly